VSRSSREPRASVWARLDPAAVLREGDEGGRGREVAVPDVVLHRLEVPHALAGRRVQAEDAVRVEVVAWRFPSSYAAGPVAA
jgi:hypothetical protein